MKYTQFLPLAIVSLGIGARHVAYWCTDIAIYCGGSVFLRQIFGTVILQIYFFSLVVLIVAVAVCFVHKQTFSAWLRFAAWWLPISAILVAITPEISNSWMPLYFVGKDSVTIIMASLFTIISLGIIAYKQFDLGKKTK